VLVFVFERAGRCQWSNSAAVSNSKVRKTITRHICRGVTRGFGQTLRAVAIPGRSSDHEAPDRNATHGVNTFHTACYTNVFFS
jgi:hypothetical protein